MNSKQKVIIEELKRVSKLPQFLATKKFKRGDFLSNTNIVNRGDVEKEFGSFENLIESVGLLPYKSYKVDNEKLFAEYGKAYKQLGYYPLGTKGLSELAKITRHSSVIKKRFGGLKNFIFEYKNWQIDHTYKIIVSDKISIEDNLKIKKIRHKEEQFENFGNKGRYVGQATEHLVIAELLSRGFNAHGVTVDEGIDVSATRGDRKVDIQVKHTYYEDSGRGSMIARTVLAS